MKRLTQLLFTAIIAFGVTTAVFAQPSDNITASADVLATLSVTGSNNLDFGNVTRGVNKAVAESDAAAGTFDIVGGVSASVALSFTLPTDLSDGGVNTMPIVFSVTDASWDGSTNDNVFDPAAGTNATLDGGGTATVFIGGTVQPGGAQVAGNYTATITLAATYN